MEVLEDANSLGLIITLIFFELNILAIFTTSGSLVETKIESIRLQFISCSSLILQRPPWTPEKVFVFLFGTLSLPARIGKKTFIRCFILIYCSFG